MSAEHSDRWRRHEPPHAPLYHWGKPKPDGTRPHHYGTADPAKCPFCNPDLNDPKEAA